MLQGRKRIYALASWTIRNDGKGWFIRKTDSPGDWCGPYTSEISACLMIARQLRNELSKRDEHAARR